MESRDAGRVAGEGSRTLLSPFGARFERAHDQRDGGLADIKSDRLMRGLVGDPRYKAFLRKLKLPE